MPQDFNSRVQWLPPEHDSRGPDPKQLLASGQVSSSQLFEAVLADRDRLIEKIAEEQAAKREFEASLLSSHQLVELQRREIETLKAGARRGPA